MSGTHDVVGDPISGHDPMTEVAAARVAPEGNAPKRLGFHFWRHFLGMLAVMIVGMIVSAAVLLSILRMTWNEATLRHPVTSLVVLAFGMSIPMAAWMRYRGHSWRSSTEMAAAMLVPAIPFLLLVWLHITEAALCGAYCAMMVPVMLIVMLWRSSEYAM